MENMEEMTLDTLQLPPQADANPGPYPNRDYIAAQAERWVYKNIKYLMLYPESEEQSLFIYRALPSLFPRLEELCINLSKAVSPPRRSDIPPEGYSWINLQRGFSKCMNIWNGEKESVMMRCARLRRVKIILDDAVKGAPWTFTVVRLVTPGRGSLALSPNEHFVLPRIRWWDSLMASYEGGEDLVGL